MSECPVSDNYVRELEGALLELADWAAVGLECDNEVAHIFALAQRIRSSRYEESLSREILESDK